MCIRDSLSGILDSMPSAAQNTTSAKELLSGKDLELKTDPKGSLAALVFKTIVDTYGKISYLRVFSGSLHANSTAYNPRTHKDERCLLYTSRCV